MTVIRDNDVNLTLALAKPDTHCTVGGKSIECIDDQVRDDLQNFSAIDLSDQTLRQIFHQAYLSRFDGSLMNAKRGFRQDRQVNGYGCLGRSCESEGLS